jgi:hypothetical protein
MKTTLLLVALTGCFASSEGKSPPGNPPPDEPTARQLFEQNVYPILETRCAGCHGESAQAATSLGFMEATAAASYDRITQDTALVGDFSPTAAPILLQKDPTHAAMPHYTQGELDKITQWLSAELTERQ